MSRYSPAPWFAGLSILLCGVSVSAETLRCQSVNGNLNCAGSSGASCQTVNGTTVCVSGHGDVVQSFGGDKSSDISRDANDGADLQDWDKEVPDPVAKQWSRQHEFHGRKMLLERDGATIRPRTDWPSTDRD